MHDILFFLSPFLEFLPRFFIDHPLIRPIQLWNQDLLGERGLHVLYLWNLNPLTLMKIHAQRFFSNIWVNVGLSCSNFMNIKVTAKSKQPGQRWHENVLWYLLTHKSFIRSYFQWSGKNIQATKYFPITLKRFKE